MTSEGWRGSARAAVVTAARSACCSHDVATAIRLGYATSKENLGASDLVAKTAPAGNRSGEEMKMGALADAGDVKTLRGVEAAQRQKRPRHARKRHRNPTDWKTRGGEADG
eukprot:6188768-Pleurochrysis_carterae.AAC.1